MTIARTIQNCVKSQLDDGVFVRLQYTELKSPFNHQKTFFFFFFFNKSGHQCVNVSFNMNFACFMHTSSFNSCLSSYRKIEVCLK